MNKSNVFERALPVVLVVEHDQIARRAIVDVLSADSYQVVEASDGVAALRLLRDGFRPVLIVLDLMMPVMNGWEFRSHQAADPEIAMIPVVVLTGAMETPLDPGVLSAAGLLRKPVSPDALLATAARLTRS